MNNLQSLLQFLVFLWILAAYLDWKMMNKTINAMPHMNVIIVAILTILCGFCAFIHYTPHFK